MELSATPLHNEIVEILERSPLPVHYTWRAEFTANGKVIEPLRVLSLDIVRNYAGAFADEIVLEVMMGAGTYTQEIYPYRENITVMLYRDPIGEVETRVDLSRDIEAQDMRAVLVESQSRAMEGNMPGITDKDAADLGGLWEIQFQLLDKALEQVRMMSVGGLFRNTVPHDLLRYMLTHGGQQVKSDLDNAVVGVEIYEPDNTEQRQHIVVPHGTPLVEPQNGRPSLPEMLQEKCGIYSTDMGYYLQKNHWYVYPLYDITRFDNDQRTLTLINVPPNRLPGVERTFRRTANQVIALVTGEVVHLDNSESMMANRGNGVRFANAKFMLEGFGRMLRNKLLIDRAINNNEFKTIERQSGLNNVQLSPNAITSNPFAEASRLAQHNVSKLLVKWENSDPGAIYPGMPVKYMYMNHQELVEVTGIVLKVHHYISTNQPGMAGIRHVCNTGVMIAVDRHEDSNIIQ